MKQALTASVFLKPVTFVAGVATVDQFPKLTLPEIAFIGRSNVGKSSLLNALTNNGKLARTSSHPGHTRQLNFFNVDGVMHLVDVPGYGYAKAPKHMVKKWQNLLFDYLRGRPQLARAFVLVDARHAVTAEDGKMLEMLDGAAVSYQLVLTKADKVDEAKLAWAVERAEAAAAKRPAAFPGVLVTSAETKRGIDALRLAVIDALSGRR